MSTKKRELMRAISLVSDNADLRVCVKQSGKGALVCGAMCLAGGILMGPRGLAIGGTVGGLVAHAMSGSFRPVGEILMNDITEQQQEQLVKHVKAAAADVGVSDLALLMALLNKDANMEKVVLRMVKYFVTNVLRFQIIE